MTDAQPTGSLVSIALLHYPVYDKNRRVVATAVTNLDIHDMARLARTYGLFRYYVVTPVAEQQDLAERVRSHWQDGWGGSYNPTRREAMELLRVMTGLEDVLEELRDIHGRPARIVATGAGERNNAVTGVALRQMMREEDGPFLILFGTGWGLTDEIFDLADMVLEPIKGAGDYNHLSVRAAAAIIMDRLLGGR